MFRVYCPDGQVRNCDYPSLESAERRAAELDDACLYERLRLGYTPPSSCPWREWPGHVVAAVITDERELGEAGA